MPSHSAKFEDILEIVGEFGRFQVIAIVILALVDMTNGTMMLYFIFSNADLGWHCGRFANNVTLNASLSSGLCSYNGSRCEDYVFHGDLHSIVTEV